jgi:hypothetical protein
MIYGGPWTFWVAHTIARDTIVVFPHLDGRFFLETILNMDNSDTFNFERRDTRCPFPCHFPYTA